MKRILFFALMALSALFVSAENYPYRSDVLWVTRPDHSDWLYQCGENAKIDVEFFKYGVPKDGVIEYEIATDMLSADKSGKAELHNGKAVIDMGTKKTPGFRDLRLKFKLDGTTYSHHIKVGFSVDKIVPYTKEPSDFVDYWKKAVGEMREKPLTYTRELAKEYCTDKVDCYLVKLNLNSQGQSVYGYLFYPKDACVKSCPAVLCPPGAGIKTIKEPLRHKYYAENGMIRFEIEIHGLDPRLTAETFSDISRAFNGRENGYLSNGIDNRDTYYMKRVYLACVRALDFLRMLPEWDGKNLIVQGGSQGGALSIITSALDNEHVTHCVANHPALADMAGYAEKGHTGGYPHFRDSKFLTKDRMNTMAYYDVVNFAPYVKAHSYITWGYNDLTCPPTTSYAVWNRMTC
ncbi:MAG: acetylxylan esterase, partial [Prevotellaceae bacterium]|nr:acetylxylan esterase [Prevotellaceae bacterium]